VAKKDPAEALADKMLQQAEQRRRAAEPLANLTADRPLNSTGSDKSPSTVKDTFKDEGKIKAQIAQRRREVLVVRRLKRQRGG
jgi:transcription initiation factor TFIIIB Brf1 subunit/transcription initiation factor TFIIB